MSNRSQTRLSQIPTVATQKMTLANLVNEKHISLMKDVDMAYWTYRGSKWTFLNKKAKHVVESHINGKALNTCAGITQLDHNDPIIRNDLQEEITLDTAGRTVTINGETRSDGDTVSTCADYHYSVEQLANEFPEESFQTIIHDPPWSIHQHTDNYGLQNHKGTGHTQNIKKQLHTLLEPGGTFINLSFSSQVMPPELLSEYNLEHISLFNTFGRKRDFFITVAKKRLTERKKTSPIAFAIKSVYPNEQAVHIDAENIASSGNDGNPITLLVVQKQHKNCDLGKIKNQLLSDLIEEKTLDVNYEDNYTLSHDSLIIHTHPTIDSNKSNITHPSHETPKYDKRIDDERLLSDRWAEGIFDTVILNLPEKASSQTVPYNGEQRGRFAAAVRSATDIISPNGNAITISDTATCMPGELPYFRDVVITLPETNETSCIITKDKKINNCGCKSSITEDAQDNSLEQITVTPRYYCCHCGEGTFHHPAYTVSCPVCGANKQNYCIHTNRRNEIRPVPHTQRISLYESKHKKRCNHNATGPPHRRSKDISPPTDASSQQTLEKY